MSTRIPIHLLKNVRVLADVPRSAYVHAPRCEDPLDEKKRRSFLRMLRRGPAEPAATPPKRRGPGINQSLNAALWCRIFGSTGHPVSLALVCRDQKGDFGVIVDEASVAESGNLMLSGRVEFPTYGPIELMQACCVGVPADARLVIDELFVQPAQSQSGQRTGSHRA